MAAARRWWCGAPRLGGPLAGRACAAGCAASAKAARWRPPRAAPRHARDAGGRVAGMRPRRIDWRAGRLAHGGAAARRHRLGLGTDRRGRVCLASGLPVLRADSDLDLVLRSPCHPMRHRPRRWTRLQRPSPTAGWTSRSTPAMEDLPGPNGRQGAPNTVENGPGAAADYRAMGALSEMSILFTFPGQGAQRAGMLHALPDDARWPPRWRSGAVLGRDPLLLDTAARWLDAGRATVPADRRRGDGALAGRARRRAGHGGRIFHRRVSGGGGRRRARLRRCLAPGGAARAADGAAYPAGYGMGAIIGLERSNWSRCSPGA